MNLAPIILFVYNRPLHTLQTLEALRKDHLAKHSELIIFADGPKINSTIQTLKNISRTREILKSKQWCKIVKIYERKRNLGLAKNVIAGVSEVLEENDRVIVLEDDIVVSRNFLKFMNRGLDLYGMDKKVYGISGYTFESNKPIEDETYFLPIMSSWGYGTWKDRWGKINFNAQNLLQTIDKNKIRRKIDFSHHNYYKMLQKQVLGEIDSWAVRFYVSMYIDGGLFLYPRRSYLQNIGLDGSGVHCDVQHLNIYPIEQTNQSQLSFEKIEIGTKSEIVAAFDRLSNLNYNLAMNTLKKKLKRILPQEFLDYARRKFGKPRVDTFSSLRNFPRYTQTETYLKGNLITIPDSASFLFMHREIFVDHIYKFQSQSDSPYIIDAGANIGLASIYFKELYPKSQILSFEPDEKICSILRANLKSFGYNDVLVEQKGLWNKSDRLNFTSEGADAGFISEIDDSSEISQSIDVVSLNEYVNKKVDFLKIDIEGAETVVLRDIAENLDKVERIFIEYHSFVSQKQTLSEILVILVDNGFRYHINAPGLTSKMPLVDIATYNNMDMQLNIYGFKS